MKYFVPDLDLSSTLPQQARLEDKLGGLPWGLPAARWPMCATCGKPQTLLAELGHSSDRLDLMADGRVLFVFHCNNEPGMCDDWDQDSGGNAAFILERDELCDGQTPVPDPEPPSYPEARVARWLQRDDGLDAGLYSSFFREASYLSLGEEIISSVPMSTRLGGVPAWIQSADEAPQGEWRFIGQLDSRYSFFRPMPALGGAPRALDAEPDPEQFEGRLWSTEGPNFGDGGIGYLFLRPSPGVPQCRFFWQCG